jgi:hypothetical protein
VILDHFGALAVDLANCGADLLIVETLNVLEEKVQQSPLALQEPQQSQRLGRGPGRRGRGRRCTRDGGWLSLLSVEHARAEAKDEPGHHCDAQHDVESLAFHVNLPSGGTFATCPEF